MSKYKSIYSPDKEITAAQYISELVCKNKAKNLKLTLPLQFYKLPEWSTFYQAQIIKANEYLEKYNELILIKVINSKNIYSLHAKWIDKEFQKETANTISLISSIEEPNYNKVTKSIGRIKKDIDTSSLDG